MNVGLPNKNMQQRFDKHDKIAPFLVHCKAKMCPEMKYVMLYHVDLNMYDVTKKLQSAGT